MNLVQGLLYKKSLSVERLKLIVDYNILISMSTPAGSDKLVRASIVLAVVSRRSIILLWILISNCSRAFFETKVDLFTVNFLILVGRGIGPAIMAPVRSAVSIIILTALSIIVWSNAFKVIRMRCVEAAFSFFAIMLIVRRHSYRSWSK